MRIIFMGTPEFAVPSLNALVEGGHDVIAAYTQPPRRAGRGKATSPSAVHHRAQALGIEVRHPVRLRDPANLAAFAALNADIAVVAAYGLILPQAILEMPRLGCLNVHGSLLPRWRGAAPVQRAILAGDTVTGVTIMQMEAGLDTGPMLATRELGMADKSAGMLTTELAEAGALLLVETLADLPAHPPILQPEDGVTYAPKIDKAEARLDFLISAPQLVRQVRAFAPVPGAFFEHKGERIRILSADVYLCDGARPATVLDAALTIACNPGAIRPRLVQRAGKSAMLTSELLRGCPIPPGTILE